MQDISAFEPLWGEWRSVEMLGQGTFGRVYKMVKNDLDQEYYAAVKHLSLPKEPGEEKDLYTEGLVTDQETLKTYYDNVLKDLRSEIDLCYKLKGITNIVSYEDHYIRPKSTGIGYDIFIKMELLTGLQDRIKEGGLTMWDVVKLGEDICKALTVLRREMIIHRDIKPGNIFINNGGDYKLGDFGVSRLMERTVSNMSVKGTPSYMAPEVVKGSGGDYRVDIYSLGLVLYRQLNKNRGPFLPLPPRGVDKELYEDSQERRFRGEPLPPPAYADEKLGGIILKACAYRPEDRWESAEEMGKALTEYRLSMKQSESALRFFEAGNTTRSSEQVQTAAVANDRTAILSPSMDADPEPTHKSSEPGDTARSSEQIRTDAVADDRTAILSPSVDTELEPTFKSFEPENTAQNFEQIRTDAVANDLTETLSPGAVTESELFEDYTQFMVYADLPGGTSSRPPQVLDEQPPEDDLTALLLSENADKRPPQQDGTFLPKLERVGRDSATLLSTTAEKMRSHMIAVVAAVIFVGVIGVFALTPRPADSTSPSGSDASSVFQPSNVSTQLDDNAPEPILWQDPFIRGSVLDILGVDESALTLEALAGLEELSIPVPVPAPGSVEEPEPPDTVTTLADLSMLTGLKTLDLSGHPLEKFDFPEELPALETLKLAGCGCVDLDFLSPFGSLRVLDLSGNEITDLAPLAGLTGLTELNINGTRVGSLEPLRGLSALTLLSALEIPAEDWSPVGGVAQVDGRPESPVQPEQTQKPIETTKPGNNSTPSSNPSNNKPSKPNTTTQLPQAPTTPTAPTTPAAPTTIAVSSVSVSPSNIMLEVGGSARLSASVSPSNATNQKVSWSSSNTSVATVDGSGNVKAVDRGTARITATCDGKSGSCTITVD